MVLVVQKVKNFLSQIREKRGIKQKVLAEAVGKSPQTISDFERGKINLSKEVLLRIANYLNTTIDEIFDDKPSDFQNEHTKKRMIESVEIASFHNELGREIVLEIAQEIFDLLSMYDCLKTDEEKKKFIKSLKKKYLIGLAANSLINKKFLND